MKHWARKVEGSVVYLEFLDVFMLCAMHGLGFNMYTYAAGLWYGRAWGYWRGIQQACEKWIENQSLSS